MLKTGECKGIFEPMVTESYLNSYMNYVDLITKVVSTLPVSLSSSSTHKPISEISVSPLDSSSFYVGCYGWKNDRELFTALRIFCKKRSQTKTGYVGVALKYDPQGKVVFGEYENGSNASQYPICNISGVLAPLEDAFVQSLANMNQAEIIRVVYTGQPLTSRFVQNYLLRGYNQYLGTNGQHNILERTFAPLQNLV